MNNGLVSITVTGADGSETNLELPVDVSLNLMEVLKGEGFPVEAVCGGMALCATCRIKILQGGQNLPPRNAAEEDMLDTLPDTEAEHRLACQISDFSKIDGMHFLLDPAE